MILVYVPFFMMLIVASNTEESQTRPENEILLLGQEYVWPCKIDNDQYPVTSVIVWINEKYNTDTIYTGTTVLHVLKDKYEVIEKDTSDYKRRDLKFKQVSFDEADIYHCTKGIINRHGYSANIIVADPTFTNCDIFPMHFDKKGYVLVEEGDSIKITCHVKYKTMRNCKAEGLWIGSQGINLQSLVNGYNTDNIFSAILDIDENFKNTSNYIFSLKFKCQMTDQTKADYSTKEPIFETNYATPTFYLKAKTSVIYMQTTSPTTESLHSGASELNPTERAQNKENQPMTMTWVFAGILAFFAILVIILVTLFLIKYRRRTSDESLTMYARGQSMMTENVAYRRQPVSCENSYNMQTNNNLTPPPQGFQGIMSPHVPHSAAPLLHQGLQPFHHGASYRREASVEDSEVYDKIDDKGLVPSIYLDNNLRTPFSTLASSSSSSQLPHFTPSIIGYIPMASGRLPAGHHVPSIPSSPAFFNPDPGVYLVPQDNKIESQLQ